MMSMIPALRRFTFLHGIALATVIVVLLPLVYLVIRAASAGAGAFTYLLDSRTLTVIANSLILTVTVVAASTVIGLAFAWLVTRTSLPFRRGWLVIGLLPMVIPSYIGALCYIEAFSSRGLLYQTLKPLLDPLGITELPGIYGFFGAWLSITLFTYPYIVLPVRAALQTMDPALEETARSLGLGHWQVFWRVTLPQLRPAIGVGVLLTALYTLSEFGAVARMQFDAFTRVIYLQYTSSFDRSRAALLSLVLVVITIGLLILFERRMAVSRRNYRAGVGAQRRLKRLSLGKWKGTALLFCMVLIGLGVVTPLIVIMVWLQRGLAARGGIPTDNLLIPALNSAHASGQAALLAGMIALPLAILAVRSASRSGHWLVALTYVGNALPGLVIALSLVFFVSNALTAFYQTLPVLILGYVVRFLPIATGATRSALTQVNPRFEEAARSLGFPQWRVLLRVTLPLMGAGMISGIAQVFLNAMKELPTTLLLAPTGFKTLATQIWNGYDSATYSQVAPPSLLLIGLSALSLLIILWQEHNQNAVNPPRKFTRDGQRNQ